MTKSLSSRLDGFGFSAGEIDKVAEIKARPNRDGHKQQHKHHVIGLRVEKICPACKDFVLARNNCLDCGFVGRKSKAK